MAIDAAHVARHKIFCGKPIFVDKKWIKKRLLLLLHFFTSYYILPLCNKFYRFGELSTEERQEITDNAIPVSTKTPTKFGMRLFNGTYPLRFP